MKEIPLTQGHVAIVDDEDYERISESRWHLGWNEGHQLYAARGGNRRKNADGNHPKTIVMHREILHAGPGQFVDHIDGNGLNNQKSNLRFCTLQQNRGNARKYAHASSKFKGVRWKANKKRWYACIGGRTSDGKETRKHLGSFKKEEDAARAYDTAAVEIFGEFANLNFPRTLGIVHRGVAPVVVYAMKETK